MRVLDLRKDYKELYAPRAGGVHAVDLPPLRFAAIEGAIERGRGPGDSPGFAEASEALYGLCFTLKFAVKKRAVDPVDYPVMPLEGLWWVEDGHFDLAVKDNWKYRLMILQPTAVGEADFSAALDELRAKKNDSPALGRLRLVDFDEGPCVQALHIGPYATEPETMGRMLEFMAAQGLKDRVGPGAFHHEVYLGDPRRSDPSKLKTILRHPVAKA
jgi:hypothetical protein